MLNPKEEERLLQLLRFKDALAIVVMCHMTDSTKKELCQIKSGIISQIDNIIENSMRERVVL